MDPQPGVNTSSALSNIKHVIVLMFENRSFDHILGAMPGVDGVLNSDGTVKKELYNTMNPLQPCTDCEGAFKPTPIVPDLVAGNLQKNNAEGLLINHDFNHDFGDGMLFQLFGPGATGIIQGEPQNAQITFPTTNSGFVASPLENEPCNGPGAMTYFEWKSMKVFHTLAEQFLVFDRWHCDMPGHTSPNRAFMHCATTGDLGINDDEDVSTHMVNRPTIFERIQQNGQTWKMYSASAHCDTNWLNEQVLSQDYRYQPHGATNVTQVPLSVLQQDLSDGTLPFYSFIMCWNYTDPDTTMHPASRVEAGENLLASVYNTLRNSPHWDDTLLIVTFDENGGMYDHNTLPNAVPPDFDINSGQAPPIWTWHSNLTGSIYSYDFTTLGVRVPVLMISPWLNKDICSQQFQNTSILRFLQDMLPSSDSSRKYWLTYRDKNAPTFAPVFDYSRFGCSQLREDCPTTIQGYAEVDLGPSETLAEQTLLATSPSRHEVKIAKMYLGPLPGHPDSGKPLTRDFNTVAELRAYTKERMDAALAYLGVSQHENSSSNSHAAGRYA